MTVEVFLFDTKGTSSTGVENSKTMYQRSPLNKSVENLCKGTRVKKSASKPKINLPVYHKYINQTKKVSTSSKLKEMHKKMHSSIMNSFVSTKNDVALLNCQTENRTKRLHASNVSSIKGSSSFIFSNKSPLNTAKNSVSQNFILKNKKSVRNITQASDECKRKGSKSKRFKRNLSKKSVGGTCKNSSYSTSKIKGSAINKAHEQSSVMKYNSFINS